MNECLTTVPLSSVFKIYYLLISLSLSLLISVSLSLPAVVDPVHGAAAAVPGGEQANNRK